MTARKSKAPRLTVGQICHDLQVTPAEWEQWRLRGQTPQHTARYPDGALEVRQDDYERWCDDRAVTPPDAPGDDT